MLISSENVRIENKVSQKIFPVKIYKNESTNKIYLKSIFNSNEKEFEFDDNRIYLIDFKARTIDKIMLGILAIVSCFPFFVISTKNDLYPIITAAVFWGVIKLLYNPLVIRNNDFTVRELD